MEAIKYRVRISSERELTLKLPPHIPVDQLAEVIVIVESSGSVHQAKIAAVKEAMQDAFFIQDLSELAANFKTVDSENWESSRGI